LIYLHAPGLVGKALKQMTTARTQDDMMHYLFHLRTMPVGFWTLDQRKEYFGYYTSARTKLPHPPEMAKWFAEAGRPYSDGASFNNFLRNFFREAVKHVSEAERKDLATLLDSVEKVAVPNYETKPRKVVKEWKMADVEPLLKRVDRGRNFDRGKEAYVAGQCIKCHRFGDDGGSV